MRFLKAHFEGYIGFKNGMGLDKIDIDFTKCKNKIILISGMNGSGKSTLLGHLNIFPDPSSSFTPGMDAIKSFTILDNDIIYDIQIISAADNSGGRKTTKAFIQKNGQELNQNGNITSYKDIIYSEFELDNNYITLSHLSNDGNKGLGSLTPAERKRFTSNIMENLEVYNEMYKTLNKKSSVYKSYINNLHAKIQNIGSKDYIESTLKQLREKEHSTSVKIMELNNLIVTIQAKCTIDEDEMNYINNLNNEIEALKEKYDSLNKSINNWFNRTKIKPEDISNQYDNDNRLLNEYNISLETSKSDWINLSNTLSTISKNIQSIEAQSILVEDNNIESHYKESKSKIESLTAELNSYGMTPDISYIEKIKSLLKLLEDILRAIDALFFDTTANDLNFVCLAYDSSAGARYQESLQDLFQRMNALSLEISEIRSKLKQVTILEERPKKCNIDECPFIKEALNITKEYGNAETLSDELARVQKEINDTSDLITQAQELIESAKLRDIKKKDLDKILELIDNNIDILKLFNINILTEKDKFLELLSRQYSFNQLRDTEIFVNCLNLLIEYDSENRSFEKLSIQYNAYKDKLVLIESNNNLLKDLKSQESELIEKVNKAKKDYDTYSELISSFSNKVNDESLYKDDYLNKLEIEKELNKLNAELIKYNQKVGKSAELLSQIKGYKDQIEELTNGVKPISDEITRLTGNLTMLESYYKDYENYNSQFNMIETLKKYCSPTSGGIQVLFMQMYMSKTLELSNNILSMLFNNEYRLLDFIINSNEFRIPFIGNGLPVDDISSGSSSQVCMMSMIINLVLLHQASTKFNIARLDEIDDSLDTYNRSNFVNVLYRILPLLNIEQLFIISHSIELDSSFADVIKLKSYEEYDTVSSNIIWDYKEEIK